MYRVDVYLRVRRAVMVEGKSIRGGLQRVWPAPGHRAQDAGLLGPAGVPETESAQEAQIGALHWCHRPDPGGRSQASQEADATLPSACFERLRDEYGFDGGYHHGQGLCKRESPSDKGDVRAVVPSAGPRPVRLRRGPGGHRRRGAEGPLFRHPTCPTATAASSRPTRRSPPGPSWTAHVSALAFLGGVPQSILYDTTRLAVAKILGDGRRQRTRAFTELQSHYLFEDRFGRPGKGNDKGKVEGLVGYMRRNFLVPAPRMESFEAAERPPGAELPGANGRPAQGTYGDHQVRGWSGTWTPLLPLPPVAYDACDKQASRVSSLSLVR